MVYHDSDKGIRIAGMKLFSKDKIDELYRKKLIRLSSKGIAGRNYADRSARITNCDFCGEKRTKDNPLVYYRERPFNRTFRTHPVCATRSWEATRPYEILSQGV